MKRPRTQQAQSATDKGVAQQLVGDVAAGKARAQLPARGPAPAGKKNAKKSTKKEK